MRGVKERKVLRVFDDLSVGAKVGVLLLAMLAIGGVNVAIVYYYQSLSEKDSQVINVAGRQRMLTQEMAKLVNGIAGGDYELQSLLGEVIEEYDNSLRALRDGGEAMGYELPPAPKQLRPLIDKNAELWSEFKRNAEMIRGGRHSNARFHEALEYIVNNNEELLERSAAVVRAYGALPDKEKYTHEIDVSGRQRMLSQTMAKHALRISIGDEDARLELGENIRGFDLALKALRDGGYVMGREVKPAPPLVMDKIKEVEDLWTTFKVMAETVQQEPMEDEAFHAAHEFISAKNIELRDLSHAIVMELTRLSDEKTATRERMLLLLLFLDVGVFAVGYFVAKRTVGNPLKEITDEARRISGGDFTAREIRGAERSDEIGQLSRAFNEMLTSLRGLVSEVKRSAQRVSSASQELAATSEEMTATTSQVSSSVEEIATGAQSQSRRIELTVREMMRMAEMVQQVSEKAQAAARSSIMTEKTAQVGGGAAKEANKKLEGIQNVIEESALAIRELGVKSRRIGEIVDVITGIAEQTNLLALNAAIEAARAGEHGRGFAVVAEEVRKLAENSARAAEEIGELIKVIQGETDRAVKIMEKGRREMAEGGEIVRKALESLEEIVVAVKETAAYVQNINEAAREQSAITDEVVKAFEEIAATAEQAAASTEEASAASEEQSASMEEISSSAQELASLALRLEEATKKFRVNGEGPSEEIEVHGPSTIRAEKRTNLKAPSERYVSSPVIIKDIQTKASKSGEDGAMDSTES